MTVHLLWHSVRTPGISLVLLALPALAAGAASPLHVQAGAGTPDQAVQVLAYFPGTLTVDIGDTVTWSIGSGEPHTVSFGPPPGPLGSGHNNALAGGSSSDGTGWVSSGLSFQGKTYSLTFTKPGTYHNAWAWRNRMSTCPTLSLPTHRRGCGK